MYKDWAKYFKTLPNIMVNDAQTCILIANLFWIYIYMCTHITTKNPNSLWNNKQFRMIYWEPLTATLFGYFSSHWLSVDHWDCCIYGRLTKQFQSIVNISEMTNKLKSVASIINIQIIKYDLWTKSYCSDISGCNSMTCCSQSQIIISKSLKP